MKNEILGLLAFCLVGKVTILTVSDKTRSSNRKGKSKDEERRQQDVSNKVGQRVFGSVILQNYSRQER